MKRFRYVALGLLCLNLVALCGCDDAVPRDTASLLLPSFQRSELIGLLAGFGTTFAALPDLILMFKRRSAAGMNPRMAMILGVFQILWVYYGLLIASRPVLVWNVIAVVINFISVRAFYHFERIERARAAKQRCRNIGYDWRAGA